MKKTIFIVGAMLCCLSMIAQTKFSGVVVNQKFSEVVKQFNAKYTLKEPDYKACKENGYSTYVMHVYYINFLGEDNTRLVVYPDLGVKDAVESISIETPFWCYTEMKDTECENSLRAYMQHLKSTYESKYGPATVEIKNDKYSTTTHNKWDLDDVEIDIVLSVPTNEPVNVAFHASTRVTVKYVVKSSLVKNKGKDVSIDDI